MSDYDNNSRVDEILRKLRQERAGSSGTSGSSYSGSYTSSSSSQNSEESLQDRIARIREQIGALKKEAEKLEETRPVSVVEAAPAEEPVSVEEPVFSADLHEPEVTTAEEPVNLPDFQAAVPELEDVPVPEEVWIPEPEEAVREERQPEWAAEEPDDGLMAELIGTEPELQSVSIEEAVPVDAYEEIPAAPAAEKFSEPSYSDELPVETFAEEIPEPADEIDIVTETITEQLPKIDIETDDRPVSSEELLSAISDIAVPDDASVEQILEGTDYQTFMKDKTQEIPEVEMTPSQETETAEASAAAPEEPESAAAAGGPESASDDPFESDAFKIENNVFQTTRSDSFETRSILKALSIEDPDTAAADNLNKVMLAPSIERGTDVFDKITETENSGSKTKDIDVPEKKNVTEHPIFTEKYEPEVIVPAESSRQVEDLEIAVPDNNAPIEELTAKAAEVAAEGVLNVETNAEDKSFKKFFGNTVIMDGEPIKERLRRAAKKQQEEEAEEETVPDETEQDAGEYENDEFRVPDQTEYFSDIFEHQQTSATMRTVISFVLSIVLTYFNLTAEYQRFLPEAFSSNPRIFAAVNAVLLLVLIATNYKSVFKGFGKLVTFKADQYSVTSFAAIAAFIEAVAGVISEADVVRPYAACVAAFALAFGALGDRLTAKRNFSNFKAISGEYEKYATTTMPDRQFTRRITREFRDSDNRVLLKRKTGFTDGFVKYARSEDLENKKVSIPTSIIFLASLACGAIQVIKHAGIMDTISAVALAAAFGASFSSTLASALPMYRMQTKLSKIGSTVPGYGAVDDITDANCVLLEAHEIFPKGNVMLHGIKTFEKERIDKAILYAASVLINSCDTLSHVFMNVIQGKTEMLYNVDSVVYEDGLGFSFWVDKNRVLLGSRKLLENHEIEIPSRDYENRYTKRSTRDAIYLAVSGKLYAMFVVSYRPNAEVKQSLSGFAREGINIVVRSRDFNVTADRISKMYDIPRSTITVISESDMIELGKQTNFVAHAKSAMTHIGTMSSYVDGIVGCYNVKQGLKLSTMLELISMIVGILLAIALTVWGAIVTTGISKILIFHFAWLLVTSIITLVRRY